MARFFRRNRQLTVMSEINVTPLIDLAFSLLIIFMITAPLLEQTIQVTLPVESAKKQVSIKEDFKTISINESGKYFWSGKPVSFQDLSLKLADLSDLKEEPIIRIRADASLQYQKVMDVIDLVKQYQLTKISLDTIAK